MTIPEAAQQIMEKVKPTLYEFGAESYVIFAVMTDGEGQRARVVIGKPEGMQPDEIMPLIRIGVEWERGAI